MPRGNPAGRPPVHSLSNPRFPFLIVDLLTTHTLSALGYALLPPATVALPVTGRT